VSPTERVLTRLRNARRSGSGSIAKCPAHDDRQASLSIGEGRDGRVLLRCHAGCSFEEIMAALDLPLSAAFPERDSREGGPEPRRERKSNRSAFSEPDLQRYQRALLEDEKALARLEWLRGWTRPAIELLGVGIDGGRVVFPYRDGAGRLVGLARYQPNPERRGDEPKMQAAPGSKRELFPAPESVEAADTLLFVTEGEPDAVRLTSIGVPSIAVPGTKGWRPEWAQRFAGWRMCLVFDCDAAGRNAATGIAADLAAVGVVDVVVLDLDPERQDGFDVSDLLASAKTAEEREQARRLLLDMAERAPRVEPPAPEDGAALLDDMATFLRRYVFMTPEQGQALALWIVHTHAVSAADVTPYLAIRSPEKRCGKSNLLMALGVLAARALSTANISDAALFRAINAERPTVLFDEVDAIFGKGRGEREDLRGLLNAGWRRGQRVYRIGGPQKTTLEPFEVFCPKALAGIGRLPETVADRSIVIELKRKARSERVERFRIREIEKAAEPLRARVAEWAAAHIDVLTDARPELPDLLDDRAQDGWEPLLAIARHAALALSAGEAARDEDESFGVRLLANVRSIFDTDRITTADLIDALSADEEAPWGDWRGSGRPISPRVLGSLLSPYGIRSRSIRLDSGKTPKGYLREQFEDAWNRYLPPAGASIRHDATSGTSTGSEASSDPPQDGRVADAEAGAKPLAQTDVADVADARLFLGDEGLRGFLNAAYEAGSITHRERHERRLVHDRIVRARLAGEALS
jgi:uncharacterized protein DUF3631